MRAAFHTFGCKLNQHETEALASAFRGRGFVVTGDAEPADLYVVNTCTVTAAGDHKARALVRALCRRAGGAPVIVTGCSAQLEADLLASLSDRVVVVRQEDKPLLLRLPQALAGRGADVLSPSEVAAAIRGLAGSAAAVADPFAYRIEGASFRTRAFLKVQDGCDCRCAYCRVPLARGPSASLPSGEVIRRARELEAAGNREIVLTGVNISSWREGALGLVDLIERLLASTSGSRIRLSSIEPEAITPELARVVGAPRICPHFHLPVQSGSDAVLHRMRRRYRAETVVRGVERLREAKGDPFIAADILCGFPGESDADHEQTVRLVERAGFSRLHVFPFSPRPGTEAAGLKPRVPERLRDQRAGALRELSARMLESYRGRWDGREVEVLLEGGAAAGGWRGTSENYLKVLVSGLPAGSWRGSVVRARLREGGREGEFRG